MSGMPYEHEAQLLRIAELRRQVEEHRCAREAAAGRRERRGAERSWARSRERERWGTAA